MATMRSLGFSIFSRYDGSGVTRARRDISDFDIAVRRNTSSLNSWNGRLILAAKAAAVFGPALVPIGAHMAAIGAAATAMGVSVGAALTVYGAATKGAIQQTLALAAAHKKLTPAQKEFVSSLNGMKAAWKSFIAATSDKTLATATNALQGLTAGIRLLKPIIDAIHPSILKVSQDFERWMKGSSAQQYANIIKTAAVPALQNLIAAGKDVLNVLGDGFRAFIPHGVALTKTIREGAAALRQWSDGGGFQRFLAYVQSNAPAVRAFFDALGDALRTIGAVFRELGPLSLTLTTTILRLVAALPPEWIANVVKGYIAWKIATTALSAAIAIFRVGLVAWRVAVIAATAAQWAWNAAMAANPIGLVVIAIAALVAGIILLVKNWSTVQQGLVVAWNATWNAIKTAALAVWNALVIASQATGNAILTAWNAVKTAVLAVWNAINTAFQTSGAALTTAWMAVWNGLKVAAEAVWNALKTAWQAVVTFFTTAWSAVGAGLQAAWTATWNAIKAAGEAVWNAIKVAWQAVVSFFQTAWTTVATALQAAWTATWNAIKAAGEAVWNAIKAAWQAVCSTFQAAWSAAASALQSAWTATWNAIKAAGEAVWNAIKAAWQAVCQAFQAAWQAVAGALQAAWTATWNAMKAAGEAVWNAIKAAWTAAANALKTAWDTAGNALKAAWQATWQAMQTAGQAVWNTIKTAWSAAANAFKTVWDTASNALKAAWSATWESLSSVAKSAWDKIKGVIQSAVDGIKNIIGSIAGVINKVSNAVGLGDIIPGFSEGGVAGNANGGVVGYAKGGVSGNTKTFLRGGKKPHMGGGVLPGYAPGRDTIPAVLSRGEGVLVPEAVRGLGPNFVHWANRHFSHGRAGKSVSYPGFGNWRDKGATVSQFADGGVALPNGIKAWHRVGPGEGWGFQAGGVVTALPNEIPVPDPGEGGVGGGTVGQTPEEGANTPTGSVLGAIPVPAAVEAALNVLGLGSGSMASLMLGFIAEEVFDKMTSVAMGFLEKWSNPAGKFGEVFIAVVKKVIEASVKMIRDKNEEKKKEYEAMAVAGAQSVQAWAPLVLQAMAMVGMNPNQLGAFLALMQAESGGNPNAINNWDSNAAAGMPSQGLMQVIPPTFAANHVPGTSMNILDPLANIAAAAQYIMNRYGGIVPGSPYANGTRNATPGLHLVGEEGPELVTGPGYAMFGGGEQVFTAPQTAAMMAPAPAPVAGGVQPTGAPAGGGGSGSADMTGDGVELLDLLQLLIETAQRMREIVAQSWAAANASTASGWGSMSPMFGAMTATMGTTVPASYTTMQTAAQGALLGMQTATATAWTGMQTSQGTALTGMQTQTSTAMTGMQTATTTGYTGMQTTTTTAMTGMQTATTTGYTGMQTTQTTAMTTMQGTNTTAWTGMETQTKTSLTGMQTANLTSWTAMNSDTSTQWGTMRDGTFAQANTMMATNMPQWGQQMNTGVSTAFQNMNAATAESWTGMQEATRGPVNWIIGNAYNNGLARLWNAIGEVIFEDGAKTLPTVATLAKGGPVHGPGTGTSDSVPARLSRGEHVWTAREVQKAGGHGAVMRMRQGVMGGRRVRGGVSIDGEHPSGCCPPGFARGGWIAGSDTVGGGLGLPSIPPKDDLKRGQLMDVAEPYLDAFDSGIRGALGGNSFRKAGAVADGLSPSDWMRQYIEKDDELNKIGSGGPPWVPGVSDVRTTWGGVAVNQRTADMLNMAMTLGGSFSATQGSWSTGVAASAGTHAGGGVVDLVPAGDGNVGALRAVGFAAWNRGAAYGSPSFSPHIHAVALGDPTVSPAAAAQVQAYLAGGDGLAGGGPDNFAGGIPGGATGVTPAGGGQEVDPADLDQNVVAFDRGGWMPPGLNAVWNGTGKPELATPARDLERLSKAVRTGEGHGDCGHHVEINFNGPATEEAVKRAETHLAPKLRTVLQQGTGRKRR